MTLPCFDVWWYSLVSTTYKLALSIGSLFSLNTDNEILETTLLVDAFIIEGVKLRIVIAINSISERLVNIKLFILKYTNVVGYI